MNKVNFINYNGKILADDQACIKLDNRAFKYGDGLFESMHAANNQIQLFDKHLKRLKSGMKILNMEIPDIFTTKSDKLQNQINTLTNKNRHYKGARIRLSVFRQDGGLYSPKSNKVSYIIENKPLKTIPYKLNEKGLLIDIYNEQLKPINLLSSIKTTNSLFFVLAGIYKQANNLDECLLLNTRGNIVEGISSNIFIVKNDKLFTPALSEGCLPGVMRQNIIELAQSKGINIEYTKPIKIEDVEKADEIFLTNAIKGIQWVVGFKQRRFYNHTSKRIMKMLNNQQFEDM